MQSFYVGQNMNTNKLQISPDFISLFAKLCFLVYAVEEIASQLSFTV